MIEGLSPHHERVYRRFCRAVVNMPIDSSAELVLDGGGSPADLLRTKVTVSEEDDRQIKRARTDVRAMCQEMEHDDEELSLSLGQMDVLMMMAVCDVAEVMTEPEFALDGRNFND